MRKEPYSVGSYVHVIKRGARGMPIVHDDFDRWRFLLTLRHLNDTYKSDYWIKELTREKLAQTLNRPNSWPPQEKLVHILCFCLLDNHFHLLLKEIKEGGIATFMQKLGTSMANHFNTKYKEKGSLFQGAYRARTIGDDDYLRYVSAYIQVKNVFELYKGGTDMATKQFDNAYTWATTYPYSSLGDYAGTRTSPILDKEILGEIFNPLDYKIYAKEVILGRVGREISEENSLE